MTAGTIPAGNGRECVVAEGTFGPYRLVARIGSGGMGEVWGAVDTRKSRCGVLSGDVPGVTCRLGA
jgi:hypothetical protein